MALGLQANSRANRFGIRRRHRQRRGPPDSRNALPSGSRIGRTVLAFLYRERERLAVVVGFISMRVCNIANVLGFGRHGSIYATDRGLRRSPRRGGRTGVVPDVQSSDSRTDTAEISEFRS